MCSWAAIRTWRAAATADVPGMVGWSALPIASGSRRGMSYTKLERLVNVDLPQPLAPAMMVRRGGITVRLSAVLGRIVGAPVQQGFPAGACDSGQAGRVRPQPSFSQLRPSSRPRG